MKTLYIDVYFLINFTVDMLALYLSSEIIRVKSSIARLLISSVVGALFACAVTLLSLKGAMFFIILIASGALIVIIFAPHITVLRKCKLFMAFMITETLFGGAVYWIYEILDRYLYPLIANQSFGAENRKILSLALIIILSYGAIKLVFLSLSGSCNEKNVELQICFLGSCVKLSALADSGNLATDPMTLKPVVFVKENACIWLKKIGDPLKTNNPLIKSRVRVIPIKTVGGTRLLTALRVDYLEITDTKTIIKDAIIAIDEEEGSYGGYTALVPMSIFSDV